MLMFIWVSLDTTSVCLFCSPVAPIMLSEEGLAQRALVACRSATVVDFYLPLR